MKKTLYWIMGVVILLLLGVSLLFVTGLFRSQNMPFYRIGLGGHEWGTNIWRHPGMMGFRSGFWQFPMIGWVGLFFRLAILVALLVLSGIGMVLMVRALTKSEKESPQLLSARCQNCGRERNGDWQVCPYCGDPFAKD